MLDVMLRTLHGLSIQHPDGRCDPKLHLTDEKTKAFWDEGVQPPRVEAWTASPLLAISQASPPICCTPLAPPSSAWRPLGSVLLVLGLTCSVACGIFPDQGWNPCPLHWQEDSYPLGHQASPSYCFMFSFGFGCKVCRMLTPWSRVEPTPPCVGRESPKHWTAREVPHWRHLERPGLCPFLLCLGDIEAFLVSFLVDLPINTSGSNMVPSSLVV